MQPVLTVATGNVHYRIHSRRIAGTTIGTLAQTFMGRIKLPRKAFTGIGIDFCQFLSKYGPVRGPISPSNSLAFTCHGMLSVIGKLPLYIKRMRGATPMCERISEAGKVMHQETVVDWFYILTDLKQDGLSTYDASALVGIPKSALLE